MNVLVVGGAGFIGSHLVDRLLADGHRVDVVDDYSNGTLANLAEARAAGGELSIHNLDVTGDQLAMLLERRSIQTIFHVAAIPRRVESDIDYAASLRTTLAVLTAAREHRSAKVVVPLPATAMYGRPDIRNLPLKEQPVEPLGVRGVVCRAVVDLLTLFREESLVEHTVLAMANVYGPRQLPSDGVVASMVYASAGRSAPVIVGDGRQTRDFLFVDDAVDALARCVEKGDGLLINIGTGEQTQIGELWEQIGGPARLAPTSRTASPAHVTRFALSPMRARLQLGWVWWTTLEDGIARTRFAL